MELTLCSAHDWSPFSEEKEYDGPHRWVGGDLVVDGGPPMCDRTYWRADDDGKMCKPVKGEFVLAGGE